MSSKTPEQYKNELTDLNSRYNVILNEVTNAYPYAKTYPTLDKYRNEYDKDKDNLTKLKADLFLYSDSLQSDIDSVSNTISRIVTQLNKLESDNKELMIDLQSLTDKSAGAVQSYDDANFVYNYKYYENIVLFLLISGLGYTFYKSMKTSNISN